MNENVKAGGLIDADLLGLLNTILVQSEQVLDETKTEDKPTVELSDTLLSIIDNLIEEGIMLSVTGDIGMKLAILEYLTDEYEATKAYAFDFDIRNGILFEPCTATIITTDAKLTAMLLEATLSKYAEITVAGEQGFSIAATGFELDDDDKVDFIGSDELPELVEDDSDLDGDNFCDGDCENCGDTSIDSVGFNDLGDELNAIFETPVQIMTLAEVEAELGYSVQITSG